MYSSSSRPVQPQPPPNPAHTGTNYRRFQHRRIHTELDEPTPPPKYSHYTGNPHIYNLKYQKDVEKYRHVEGSELGGDTGFTNQNISQSSNKIEVGVAGKDSAMLTKSYKMSAKPTYTKYLKTEPCEDDSLVRKPKSTRGNVNGKYEIEGVAGKGTFGVVYFGTNVLSGEKVAMKKVLQDKKYKNRELEILKQVKHANILQMRDYFFTTEGSQQFLNVVMDYYSDNLYQVIKKKQLNPLLVKLYTYQVLRGLHYLGTLSIAHRDIKPQNILVDRNTHKVVICDFGSAKKLVKGQPNIAYICSRCYRAPELIFGATEYTPQIDMWSLGCVLVQMVNGEAPFLGDSQIDQLLEIIKVLGTPQKPDIQQMNPKYDLKEYKKFPNIKPVPWKKMLKTDDALLIDLIAKILDYSPRRRVTPAQALKHAYFDQLRELSNAKDQQYLRKMKIKQLPQLFNFTQEESQVLSGPGKSAEQHKAIDRNREQEPVYMVRMPGNPREQQPVIFTSHHRINSDVGYRPLKQSNDEPKDEPIRAEKSIYTNSSTLGGVSKLGLKKLGSSGSQHTGALIGGYVVGNYRNLGLGGTMRKVN